MMENRKQIGELLIEDDTISVKTLERALERGRKGHKKLDPKPAISRLSSIPQVWTVRKKRMPTGKAFSISWPNR